MKGLPLKLLQIDQNNKIKFIETMYIATSTQNNNADTRRFQPIDITIIPEYNNRVFHKIKYQTKDKKGAVW